MMQGQLIKRIHQDSGTRKTFVNVIGNPVKLWDSRGHLVTTAYDALYRVTGRRVYDGSTDRLAESYLYGEGQSDPEDHNLRGKLYQVKDGAGQVTFAEYDFKGNPKSKLQETLQNYQTAVNWDNTQTFDSTTFTTTSKYDALNRPVETVTPDNSKYVPVFNQGGDLSSVGVYLRGSTQITSFISSITYNNRRQRSTITYGNGVETEYTYDSNTFRLIRLLTERGTDVLQDFLYTYDPMGNITTMNDNATQTLYYNNNIIDADRAYTYDALYRLAVATGREHMNQPGTEYNDFPSGIALPHPNDPQAMRRYSREYSYDNAGNISEMAHTASGANWTRTYTYSGTSNRLTQTQIGSTPTSYSYDAHGNIQSLPNVTAFTWDFQDQVKEADLGGGGTAYYTYNAEGQRIRKVIHNNSDIKIKETIYLDGYEVYHEFVTGNIDFERETLHVNDDESRVAMVETKTIENGTPVTTPVPRIRYQHSDHLGSCSVETTDTGALISFEEYYPYGGTSFKSTSSSSQVSAKRYRYNGKEKDEETNLYYYGARYYISWLGRWMNCDPIGEEGSGLNLYRYASNNPVMRVDPTGMKDETVEQSVNHWTPEPDGECREQECGSKQQSSEENEFLKELEPKTTENRESFGKPLPGGNFLRNYQADSMEPMPEKSVFGPGRSKSKHQGIDIYAQTGTSAFSIGEGEVVRAENAGSGYGKVVTIKIRAVEVEGKYYPAKKGDDPTTTIDLYAHYAHLDSINIKKGDVVQQGQLIGKTGVSGIRDSAYKSEPNQHLHFEIRTKEKAGIGMEGRIDPRKVIDVKRMNAIVKPGLITTINKRMYSQ